MSATNAINQYHLVDNFSLASYYIATQTVTLNHFAVGGLDSDDLSDDFELDQFSFSENCIVSINIEAQELDMDKIADEVLVSTDFALDFIDTDQIIGLYVITGNHIKDGTLSSENILDGSFGYAHLEETVTIEMGGTGQTTYGGDGELIVVSGNQYISTSRFVMNDDGFGVNTTDEPGVVHAVP